MSTTTVEALLPHVIAQQVHSMLEHETNLNQEIRKLTTVLAKYCLTPPSSSCFKFAINFLLHQPEACPLTGEQLTVLLHVWNAKSLNDAGLSEVRLLGSRYPLFYGLKNLHQHWSSTPACVHKSVIGFYLHTCAIPDDQNTNQLSAARYYADVLAVRDALLGKIQHLSLPKTGIESVAQLKVLLLELTASAVSLLEADHGHEHENDLRKLLALRDILNGEHKIGNPSYTREPSTEVVSVPVLEADDASSLPDGFSWDIEYSPAKTGKAALDDEPDAYLKRRTGPAGSCSTLADDLRDCRIILQSVEARNTISQSDMSRLPLVTIRRFLSFLTGANGLELVFTWLLISTGCAPGRLEKLRCSTTPRPKRHDELHLDLQTGVLTIETENGATDFLATDTGKEASSGNAPARILLPTSIIRHLAECASDTPFKDIGPSIDRLSRAFARANAGIRPTLENLARSYWLHTAPNIGNDLLAAYVAGHISARLRAQAKYYRFTNSELNAVFQRAHAALTRRIVSGKSCTEPLRRFLSGLTFPETTLTGEVGSQVAVPFEVLRETATAILHTADHFTQQLLPPAPVQALRAQLDTLNAQSLNLFFMQLLAHALRPVGKKAVVTQGGHQFGAWVKDKDSSLFAERRLTPLPSIVIEQYQACRVGLQNFRQSASRHGAGIDINEAILDRGLACVVKEQTDRQGGILFSVSVMTMQDWLSLLEQHHIRFPHRSNVTRHVIASEFCGAIPQSLLDAYLGHPRGGFDVLSPYSSAVPSLLSVVTPLCEHKLRQLGCRVVRIKNHA